MSRNRSGGAQADSRISSAPYIGRGARQSGHTATGAAMLAENAEATHGKLCLDELPYISSPLVQAGNSLEHELDALQKTQNELYERLEQAGLLGAISENCSAAISDPCQTHSAQHVADLYRKADRVRGARRLIESLLEQLAV